MAKVEVKYFGLFGLLTGKKKEEICAENIGELIEKVVSKYKGIKEYFEEKTETDPTLVITYNKKILNVKNYEMKKLEDGDEIIFMSVIGGG